MAPPQPAAAKRPAPQLYLVTPLIEDAAGFASTLRDAMAEADVAAVLLRLKPAAERDLINRIKTLAPIVQGKDAALVLDGQAEIAARAGADGAHLRDVETFMAAVDSLKPARIAGCGGLRARDDAMLAEHHIVGGRRPSFDAIVERIEWWAQLFTIPCVGFAAAAHEIGPLVAAGADFIAVGDGIWDDARGAAAALAEIAGLLSSPEKVP